MKRKTRMYEPWGYRDENNYQGAEIIHENDLDSFFAGVEYKRDDNKIHFTNKDGDEVGSLNVNDFIKSDSIIEKTEYKDGILKIYFTNGDIVTIDLTELLDENEFKDGLIVNEHVVKVLVDANSERWLTVSPDGVKVSGIQAEIDRLDGRIDDEIARATGEEQRIEAKLDQEIQDRIDDVDAEETRATGEEARIEAKLDQEITRATQTEQSINHRVDTLNDELDAEESRAEAAEQEIRTLLTREINDRIADVNEEEARAKAAEQALQNAIDAEEARAISAETDLQAAITAEEARATSAEADLQAAIDAEAARATSAETELQGSIAEEGRRAQDAEADLQAAITAEEARATSAETALQTAIDGADGKIDQEITDRKAEAVASAEYNETGKTIDFYNANDDIIDSIDATVFIKDGMIESVELVELSGDTYLRITWNTDAGSQVTDINIGDIFNADNYYTKVEIDDIVDDLDEDIDNLTNAITAEQARAEGVEALKANAADVYTKGEVDGKETALQTGINTNASAITDLQAEMLLKADKTDIPTDFYTKGEVDGKETALQAGINANAEAIASEESRASSAETDLQAAIELKADKETVYTQEEVDALIKAKETEIYNLTKLVGEIGGNVTYDYPNDLGTSLTSLLNNSGTVKLGEDATITRFGPGMTAKNKVKLNLNGHDLTATSAGSYGAIMGRGTQEITIGGKGTIDAGDGICIEANGAGCTINLTGSTTVYQTDRSGGELIYCYAGTINITNGTFKNLGENKGYMLNCYDANYSAGTAKIIVTGGKFYDFNPADNNAEGEHTSFVPEGYHVETSTDGDSTVYTVKKDS